MGKQVVFSVDPNACINCKTCEMSCNEYYGLVGLHRRSVLNLVTKNEETTLNVSMACNHCSNPACMYVCPENNFQKRRDGIVVLEARNCHDCTKCIEACPFGALQLNPHTNQVDKCNFCVDRIDEGLRPVCVENCITGALGMMIVDTKELKEVHDKQTRVPITSFTKPSINIVEKQKKDFFLREG